MYRNLTGDAADPFPAFKQMLDAAFPRTAPDGTPIPSVIPGPNPDNPYPLNQYEPEVPVVARVFWQMNPGRNVVNVNWDAISADSAVMVSASEYNSNSQQLPDGSDQRFVGAADVTVANVTPHGPPFDPNHGVTFVVEVGWSSPLTICTDVAVIADAPVAVVYPGPQTGSRETVQRPRHPPHTGVPRAHEPAAHGDRQRGAHVQGIAGEDRRPHHRPPGHHLGLSQASIRGGACAVRC